MMPEISALLFKDGPFYPWSRICYKPGNCSKEEPSSIKNVLSFVNFCFEYSLNAILERLIIILNRIISYYKGNKRQNHIE